VIRASKENQAEILNFIPSMRANMPEWQIITAKIAKGNKPEQEVMMEKFLEIYKKKEGIIFPVQDYKIVIVLRLGSIDNYAVLKNQLQDKIPEHNCRVIARKMSTLGLKQIQIDLTERGKDKKDSLYEKREKRGKNVFLICDDDVSVRQNLKKLLSPSGRVHEVDTGAKVCEAYQEYNPDIVLIEVHMPEQNGLSIVNDIIDMDADAFIIMISADSRKENVLRAISSGSIGFLSKPIKSEKLIEFQSQCITIN